MNSHYLYDKNNTDYYLIIKPTKKSEKLIITIYYDKYDYFTESELNNFFILKENNSGIIIKSEKRPKSYIQMISS